MLLMLQLYIVDRQCKGINVGENRLEVLFVGHTPAEFRYGGSRSASMNVREP